MSIFTYYLAHSACDVRPRLRQITLVVDYWRIALYTGVCILTKSTIVTFFLWEVCNMRLCKMKFGQLCQILPTRTYMFLGFRLLCGAIIVSSLIVALAWTDVVFAQWGYGYQRDRRPSREVSVPYQTPNRWGNQSGNGYGSPSGGSLGNMPGQSNVPNAGTQRPNRGQSNRNSAWQSWGY